MARFRNVRVKMKGGRIRFQRAKVLASGKLKFVSNLRTRRAVKRLIAMKPRTVRKLKREMKRHMARKRRRGGRRGFRVGKWVNLGFKILGTAIAVSPAARGVKNMLGGNVEGGAKDVLFDYTGIHDNGIDGGAALKGVGTVVGAILIVKIGSWFARRV